MVYFFGSLWYQRSVANVFSIHMVCSGRQAFFLFFQQVSVGEMSMLNISRLMVTVMLVLLLPVAVAWSGEGAFHRVRTLDVLDKDQFGRELAYPSTITFDPVENETYVTDAGKGQIVVYSPDYFPLAGFGGGRGLNAIYGVFVDGDRIYVCSGGNSEDARGRIVVFDQAFLPVKEIFFSDIPQVKNFIPRKVAVGKNGSLYVVGVNSSAVLVLAPDGRYLRSIAPQDQVLGVTEKASVISLAVGNDGRLYFLSEEMGRVYVFDREEHFLFKFGQKGGAEGKLSRPRGIAVDDKAGLAYVVDYMRHAVSVFDLTGKYLFEFGGKGVGRGWFTYPTDLCVDGRGHVLVTDTFNNRVQAFEVSAH